MLFYCTEPAGVKKKRIYLPLPLPSSSPRVRIMEEHREEIAAGKIEAARRNYPAALRAARFITLARERASHREHPGTIHLIKDENGLATRISIHNPASDERASANAHGRAVHRASCVIGTRFFPKISIKPRVLHAEPGRIRFSKYHRAS